MTSFRREGGAIVVESKGHVITITLPEPEPETPDGVGSDTALLDQANKVPSFLQDEVNRQINSGEGLDLRKAILVATRRFNRLMGDD